VGEELVSKLAVGAAWVIDLLVLLLGIAISARLVLVLAADEAVL